MFLSCFLMSIYYSALSKHEFPWRCLGNFFISIYFIPNQWTAWNIRNFTNIWWSRLNQYRIRVLRMVSTSAVHLVQPLFTSGSATAGWCVQSMKSKTLQHLWQCSSIGSLPQWKMFFLCLNGISCMNMPVKCTHFFLYLIFFFIFQVFSLAHL